MELDKVFLDNEFPYGLVITPRRRKLDAAKVAALADSIKEIGLQHPISVWSETTDSEVHLVAGLHRVEAVKKLGWDDIPCFFLSLDDPDRRLWEIDENLIRAELTELERADHLNRRKEIFDAKKSSAEIIPTRKVGYKSPPVPEKGFDQDTADKIGVDKSTVRKSRRRAERIASDVQKAIEGMPAADSGVELDALASLSHDEQRQAVKMVQSGKATNFREARDSILGVTTIDLNPNDIDLIAEYCCGPKEAARLRQATLLSGGFDDEINIMPRILRLKLNTEDQLLLALLGKRSDKLGYNPQQQIMNALDIYDDNETTTLKEAVSQVRETIKFKEKLNKEFSVPDSLEEFAKFLVELCTSDETLASLKGHLKKTAGKERYDLAKLSRVVNEYCNELPPKTLLDSDPPKDDIAHPAKPAPKQLSAE